MFSNDHPLILLLVRATHPISSVFMWFLIAALLKAPSLMILAALHILAMRALPAYEAAVLSWLSLITREKRDVAE